MAPSAEVHLALEAEPAAVVGTAAPEEGPDASEWIGPLARSVITAKIWRFPPHLAHRSSSSPKVLFNNSDHGIRLLFLPALGPVPASVSAEPPPWSQLLLESLGAVRHGAIATTSRRHLALGAKTP